nr:hypothetical protein [Tanacetum cinerariifolium]
MMGQQVLNPLVEMMLVVVDEYHVLGRCDDEPLMNGYQSVPGKFAAKPWVYHSLVVVQEVSSIVEQKVRVVDDIGFDWNTMETSLPEHTIVETYKNITLEKYAYFDAEAEAIHMILSGIRDDIYSTVDACTTAKEMWIAIERKPKRAKDYAYHNQRKPKRAKGQADKGVPLRAEKVSTAETRPTFDAEPLEQVQPDDDYNVFATVRQHFEQPEFINNTHVVETFDSNVIPNSLDMCDNDDQADQNADEYEDECVMLANLIANSKLDHDENKKILKQLNIANASLTHELNDCKSALVESNDIHDRCRSALHDQEIELEKYKKPIFVNPKDLKKAQSEKPCLYKVPYDKDDPSNIFAPDSDETLTLEQESR